ncbi:MAG: hypothetical protein KGZ81_07270 [Flavobacteriales bacterium]|nr:hypothetical protein [Flavobacteriales bacterium]
MKLVFGDIVVVENNLIGVVVKNWGRGSNGREPHVEVYVRSYRTIQEYPISEVERYLVRHKELSDEDMEYQEMAVEQE